METELEEKKEVQQRIVEITESTKIAGEEEFKEVLRMVSPGTNLRNAVDGILKGGRGGLIVIENEFTEGVIEGGFKLNCRFTPQRLVELAKMDGALILSKDMKKISYANVLLTPDSKIPSSETGTRHKAAERTAKMTGSVVVAISERKHEINVYYKDIKYHLRETSEILRKTAETLQILERLRENFDRKVIKLNSLELNNDLNLTHACKTIQTGKSMIKLMKNIELDLIELGIESGTIRPRIKEIMKDVENETYLITKDYSRLGLDKSRRLLESLSYEEVTEIENIIVALAQNELNALDSIKGWRLLSKTSLNDEEISKIIAELRDLSTITKESIETHQRILGEQRGKLLNRELDHIRSQR